VLGTKYELLLLLLPQVWQGTQQELSDLSPQQLAAMAANMVSFLRVEFRDAKQTLASALPQCT
jgi:hypothetical protein